MGGERHWLAMFAALTLAACASQPPASTEPTPVTPPPSTEIYFYPTKGQSATQQERDRYECYLWAKKQTGFDPSAPGLAPHQRVRVIPTAPPGRDTAAGAVTGAVIGAVVSPPGRSAEGAAVGAVAGAVIGAASDTARQEQVERVQQRYDQQQAQRMARIEQQANSYRRAMAACLEGRSYTVH
jgi:outer membrane biogenesis lipoprotein LolB